MKTALSIIALLVSSLWCISQPSAAPAGRPATAVLARSAPSTEMLDGNYVVQVQITQSGTNRLELRLVTAQRSFKLHLDEPNLTLEGVLSLGEDGAAYLEYSLVAAGHPAEPEKRGGKAQTAGQMVNSGLVSLIFRSALHYDLHQSQADEAGKTAPAHQTSWRSSVRLALGRPVAVFEQGPFVCRLSVERLKEGE